MSILSKVRSWFRRKEFSSSTLTPNQITPIQDASERPFMSGFYGAPKDQDLVSTYSTMSGADQLAYGTPKQKRPSSGRDRAPRFQGFSTGDDMGDDRSNSITRKPRQNFMTMQDGTSYRMTEAEVSALSPRASARMRELGIKWVARRLFMERLARGDVKSDVLAPKAQTHPMATYLAASLFTAFPRDFFTMPDGFVRIRSDRIQAVDSESFTGGVTINRSNRYAVQGNISGRMVDNKLEDVILRVSFSDDGFPLDSKGMRRLAEQIDLFMQTSPTAYIPETDGPETSSTL